MNRHVATERPITLPPDVVRRFLRGGAVRLRLPVRCGTSLVDGHRRGPKRWASLDLAGAWVDPGPSPAGNPGPYLKARCAELDTVHRLYCRLQTGLRLWVRESFHAEHPLDYYTDRFRARDGLAYEADYADGGGFNGLLWEPAAKMARPLSRLDLDLVAVNVQGLLEAGNDDAAAEGMPNAAAMIEAFHEQHGARLSVGREVNVWTWVLHVTPRLT